MPNWCFTDVRVVGPHGQVEKLYLMMKGLEDMMMPLVENGFGTRWYGNLVHLLGGDCQKIHCRGHWAELRMPTSVLKWVDMSAWGPVVDVFKLIERKFPGLKVYFWAEEECNDVFVTNDADGRFFKARFFLATDWDSEYYDDEASLLQAASAQAGREFLSMEGLWDYVFQSSEWSLHEIEII